MTERTSTIETPTRRTILRSSAALATTGAIGATRAGAQDCVEDGESIQDAIDAADDGDTICVDPGTYDGAVDVDVENVTLSGPNAGTPGYEDRGDGATVEGQVVLSADGTTLDGFDVSPPDAAENQEAEAVRVSNTPDDVVVENNVVREFGEDGLGEWLGIDGINVFGGDGDEAIEDVTVRHNEVRELTGRETSGGVAGISVQGNVDGAVVEDNVVTEVGMEATPWAFGIVVRATGNHDEDPRDVDVTHNEVTDVLSTPESEGLYGVGFGSEFLDESLEVTRNSIENNELGAEISADTAPETTLVENNIVDNDVSGVLNLDDDELTATCNWWGHREGPEHEDANDAEGNVEYEPWSVTRVDDGWDGDDDCRDPDDDEKDDDEKDDPKGDDDHDKRDEKDDDGEGKDGKSDDGKDDDGKKEGKGDEKGNGDGRPHPGGDGERDRSRGWRGGNGRSGPGW